VAPNRGVIAAALLLETTLIVALPGAGLAAAGAGSEAEPRGLVPPTPVRRKRAVSSHAEWSAGVAARGQSRIGHVYND
jgi:hypothetical protein